MNQPILQPSFESEWGKLRTLIITAIFGLLALSLLWKWFQRDQQIKRSQTIIQNIQAGIQLSIATAGAFPPMSDFGLMKSALGRSSSALSELYALGAIDDTRRCFVDAWNHPLSITTGPHYSLIVVSPGRDGILGNSDDIR